MNNIEKWQIDPDKTRMSMEGYCYVFLDLDFDGVLELIASEVQGSGRYSKNSFYRISDDKTSIELIPFDESVNQKNQCDLIFEDSPVLYKNKSTGNYEYIFCDYIRAVYSGTFCSCGSGRNSRSYTRGSQIFVFANSANVSLIVLV